MNEISETDTQTNKHIPLIHPSFIVICFLQTYLRSVEFLSNKSKRTFIGYNYQCKVVYHGHKRVLTNSDTPSTIKLQNR